MGLDRYVRLFGRLRRSWGDAWPESTRHGAPHKPFLLLSILDLTEDGLLTENLLGPTPDLLDTFQAYWECVPGLPSPRELYHPLWHLRSDGFWRLEAQPGMSSRLAATREVRGWRHYFSLVQCARLDDELFGLIRDPVARELLRKTLIETYFDAPTQMRIQQRAGVNHEVFRYSMTLLRAPIVREQSPSDEPVRNQAFRRAVILAYDRRCGLCGLRIVTADGKTAVDAAHIKPWSVSRDDRPTNGMALCRLCHWAFDAGVLTVGTDYRMITSPELMLSGNIAAHIGTLHAREMVRPVERAHWPDPASLRWHRAEVFRDGSSSAPAA